jgi:hypothetical protein
LEVAEATAQIAVSSPTASDKIGSMARDDYYVIDVGDDASDMSTKRAAVEAARSYVTGRGVYGSYGRMEQVDCALVYKSTYDDHIPVFIIWRTRDRDGEEVVHTASDREMSQNSLLALVRRVYPKACGFRSPV